MIYSFFINPGAIYNYADDNTLSFIHANTDVLKKVLEEESCNLSDCFLLILWKQIQQNFRQFVLGKGHVVILLLLILTQLKLSVKIMSLF